MAVEESIAELDLNSLHLDRGNHRDPEQGHCLLEVVSMFAQEPFSDAPQCVSPYLRRFGIALNDRVTDERRQDLLRFVPLLVGTAGDGLDEQRRWIGAEHSIRTVLPKWLDRAGLTDHATEIRALAPITDQATYLASRDAVSPARSAAWALRRSRWDTIRAEVRKALAAEGLTDAVAVADADADADAVAAAAAAAAAVAAADADADAAAAAAADAVAVAVAVAAAAAVAVADADADAAAAADFSYGTDAYWKVRDAVYEKVRAIYEERYADLAAESWDDALALFDRLITAEVSA